MNLCFLDEESVSGSILDRRGLAGGGSRNAGGWGAIEYECGRADLLDLTFLLFIGLLGCGGFRVISGIAVGGKGGSSLGAG